MARSLKYVCLGAFWVFATLEGVSFAQMLDPKDLFFKVQENQILRMLQASSPKEAYCGLGGVLRAGYGGEEIAHCKFETSSNTRYRLAVTSRAILLDLDIDMHDLSLGEAELRSWIETSSAVFDRYGFSMAELRDCANDTFSTYLRNAEYNRFHEYSERRETRWTEVRHALFVLFCRADVRGVFVMMKENDGFDPR